MPPCYAVLQSFREGQDASRSIYAGSWRPLPDKESVRYPAEASDDMQPVWGLCHIGAGQHAGSSDSKPPLVLLAVGLMPAVSLSMSFLP